MIKPQNSNDDKFMMDAIQLSLEAIKNGNHPFGAILVLDGKIVLSAINQVTTKNDVTAHAELELIRDAQKILNKSELARSIMYTSTEPCAMCFGASIWAGIGTIVYGCSAEKLACATGRGSFVVPCRELANYAVRSPIIIGPIQEQQAFIVHKNFWQADRI